MNIFEKLDRQNIFSYLIIFSSVVLGISLSFMLMGGNINKIFVVFFGEIILVLGFIKIYHSFSNYKNHKEFPILWFALSLRIINSLTLFIFSINEYGSLVIGDIENTWYRETIYSSGSLSLITSIEKKRDVYFWVLDVFFNVPYIGTIIPVVINVISGCIVVIYVYKLGILLLSEYEAYIVGLLASIFPSLIFYSYHISPDMISLALSTGALYFITKLVIQPGIGKFINICIFVFLLSMFRPHQALIVGVLIVMLMVLQIIRVQSKQSLSIYLFLILVIASFIAYQVDIFTFRSGNLITGIRTYINNRTLNIANRDMDGLVLTILELPLSIRLFAGIIPLVFNPFPLWRPFVYNQSFFSKIYAFDIPLFYPLFIFSILGVISVIRGRKQIFLPLVIYFIVFTAALTTVYGGGEIRFRIQLIPIMLILSAIGLRSIKLEKMLSMIIISYFLLIVFYFIIVR